MKAIRKVLRTSGKVGKACHSRHYRRSGRDVQGGTEPTLPPQRRVENVISDQGTSRAPAFSRDSVTVGYDKLARHLLRALGQIGDLCALAVE